ncbi:hypothetical protein ONZ43_g4992 [Nemania bipapillata]|uniref:Uncharacterized protein n=1 Tax=Nemania bipapillata TaxID=110536 RepID=A0ACC2IG17_9PEZI|nr:hypothetical protein ONZ43_g4992 [Nemania bipapillata]
MSASFTGFSSDLFPDSERASVEAADRPHFFNNRTSAFVLPTTNDESEEGEPRRKRHRTQNDLPPEPEVISLLSSDEEDNDPVEHPTRRRQRQSQYPHGHDHDSILGPYYSGTATPVPFGLPIGDRASQGTTDDRMSWTAGSSQQASAAVPEPSISTQGLFTPLGSPEPEPNYQDEEVQEPPPRMPIPVKEPPLCPEQAELVDIILSGRNVFYTGSAGCGKSTVLKAFTRRLRDRGLQVDIVAPTGISALGVGGSTTFVYAGWSLTSFKQPLSDVRRGAHRKYIQKRLRDTDVLVIDEISMVENFHFERLNAVMQEARRSYKPFGGAQVIVTGDFHQLPPVKPFEYCLHCGEELKPNRSEESYVCKTHGVFRDEDKWAFKSEAWGLCNFVYFHLQTIHRQSDEIFIKILQKCRIGQPLNGDDTDLLMNHPCMSGNATKLYARRDEVRRENQKRFDKLLHTWRAADGSLESLRDHRYEALVEFKRGMLVVLLTNLDLGRKLCNGSQGIICGYEEFDPQKLPKLPNKKEPTPENGIHGDFAEMREKHIRTFIDQKGVTKKVWPIVRFHNGIVRTIYADCSVHTLGNKEPYSLLSRTQIPLAAAWAMSIHKSQSLTLDRVIVDLTRAWEEGQVYVALSRATSLSGLKIEGDPRGLTVGKGGNSEVRKFHMENFGI